jgi:hypothetical protein
MFRPNHDLTPIFAASRALGRLLVWLRVSGKSTTHPSATTTASACPGVRGHSPVTSPGSVAGRAGQGGNVAPSTGSRQRRDLVNDGRRHDQHQRIVDSGCGASSLDCGFGKTAPCVGADRGGDEGNDKDDDRGGLRTMCGMTTATRMSGYGTAAGHTASSPQPAGTWITST